MGLVGEPVKPGTINLRVYDQDTYWWDLRGERHEIATMCTRYRDAVLNFLRRRAHNHAAALDFNESFQFDVSGPLHWSFRPDGWQENTLLFQALRRRPETPQERVVDLMRNLQDAARWQLKKRGLCD